MACGPPRRRRSSLVAHSLGGCAPSYAADTVAVAPLPVVAVAVQSERQRTAILQMLECIRGPPSADGASDAVAVLSVPPSGDLSPGDFTAELARSLCSAGASGNARAAAAAAALLSAFECAGGKPNRTTDHAETSESVAVLLVDSETFLRLLRGVRRISGTLFGLRCVGYPSGIATALFLCSCCSC